MKRVQIGLRLMLLLMALACVLVAYLRARLDLRREAIRTELMEKEHEQWILGIELQYDRDPKKRADFAKIKAEIAEMQRQVGELPGQKD